MNNSPWDTEWIAALAEKGETLPDEFAWELDGMTEDQWKTIERHLQDGCHRMGVGNYSPDPSKTISVCYRTRATPAAGGE